MCDIRFEEQIDAAVAKVVAHFGGIDIVVNNASAISLTKTPETSLKRFDLMHQINVRGTFAVSRAALPHLVKAENPHIVVLSPPLVMRKEWFGAHAAYTMSKYGMSMCALGLADELAGVVALRTRCSRSGRRGECAVAGDTGGDSSPAGDRRDTR